MGWENIILKDIELQYGPLSIFLIKTFFFNIIYHYFLETYEKFTKNVEKLLFGNVEISINENLKIFNKVRAYIRQTKRF